MWSVARVVGIAVIALFVRVDSSKFILGFLTKLLHVCCLKVKRQNFYSEASFVCHSLLDHSELYNSRTK